MTINLINYVLAKKDWNKAYEDLKVLEIGGRNLFTSEGWSFYNPYASEIESDGTKYLKFEEKEHSNNIIAIKNDGYVSESGVFTFSGYVKIDGQIPSESYFREISIRSGSGTPEVRFDSETGYFAITQLVPYYSWTIHGRSTTPTVDGRIIELFDIKFEKGTIATDWTPAPEDINAHPFVAELAETVYRSKQNEERIINLENALTALGGGS